MKKALRMLMTRGWIAGLLLCNVPKVEAADAFPIFVQWTTLSPMSWFVDGQSFSPGAGTATVQLTPGQHSIAQLGDWTNATNYFQVGLDGLVWRHVSNPQPFDSGVLSGEGTTTLTVRPFAINVSWAIPSGTWWSVGSDPINQPSVTLGAFNLLPGFHSLQQRAGNSTALSRFDLGFDGLVRRNVANPQPFESGVLSGEGTNTLTVRPFAINVSWTEPSGIEWSLGSDPVNQPSVTQGTLNLVPGTHELDQNGGHVSAVHFFEVAYDGLVGRNLSNPQPFESGVLSGEGTNTLTVRPFAIHVFWAEPSSMGWSLGSEPNQPSLTEGTFNLVPGSHNLLQRGYSSTAVNVFEVGFDGLVRRNVWSPQPFDAGVLSGEGTNTLIVTPFCVQISVSNLTTLYTIGSSPYYGTSQIVALVPGAHEADVLKGDGTWAVQIFTVGYNSVITPNPLYVEGVQFSFSPCNQPPLANAGSDQTVNESTPVTLDGSSSTGQNLSYSWTQLAGESVQLGGAMSPAPTFVAPQLPGGFGSQVLTFKLTVTSGSQSSSDTVDVIVRNVNHAPVAEAGDDQTVNEGSLVTLSGTNSYDPDLDPITCQWVQTEGIHVTLSGADTCTASLAAPPLPGGIGGGQVITFALTVSDTALSSSDTVDVLVEQLNHAPVADAGTAQTRHSGQPVTLDGSTSHDPDGDPLMYWWTQVSGPTVVLTGADTVAPNFTTPPVAGPTELRFRLVVDDTLLWSDPAEVVVTVVNDRPVCTAARAVPNVLWPPNHGLVPVRIVGVTDPNNDSTALTITGVAQDEPVNGLGDGDTSPDAVIQGGSVLLRAERSGLGNGRVYAVQFAADDGVGGTCEGTVSVSVPKSMKPGVPVIDDGQVYNSTQP